MKYKNYRFEENPFAKNPQNFSQIYHEVFLLMKYLQTEPQVESMNNK